MIALALAQLACSSTERPAARPAQPAPAQPDVVFISLDTTRADALSAWGKTGGRETTPNLDALAAKGARFSWALAAAPSTLSSHATVFTGLDPHATQIVRNGYPLSTEVETLAERLAANGYDTIAVLGSSSLARPMGVDQGFRLWDETFSVKRAQRHEARAKSVTDRALASLEQQEPGKPVFLFAHYYDAHSPYSPPKEFQHRWSEPGKAKDFGTQDGALKGLGARMRTDDPSTWSADLAEVRNNYLSEITYVDTHVQRLITTLDPARTIVVAFGDHGETLGEIPLRPFGHGGDCDLQETHVPLIITAPERLGGPPPGTVVQTPVGLIDLATTVLGLVGLAPIGEGLDLSPLWTAESTDPTRSSSTERASAERAIAVGHRSIFAEATVPDAKRPDVWNNIDTERAVAVDGFLLLRSAMEGGVARLYRIADDQPPVDDPVRAAAMDAELRAWDAKAPPHRDATMSDATREGLKALGYAE